MAAHALFFLALATADAAAVDEEDDDDAAAAAAAAGGSDFVAAEKFDWSKIR